MCIEIEVNRKKDAFGWFLEERKSNTLRYGVHLVLRFVFIRELHKKKLTEKLKFTEVNFSILTRWKLLLKERSTNRFNHDHLRIVSSASKVLLVKKGFHHSRTLTQSRAHFRELKRRIRKIEFAHRQDTQSREWIGSIPPRVRELCKACPGGGRERNFFLFVCSY